MQKDAGTKSTAAQWVILTGPNGKKTLALKTASYKNYNGWKPR
jgi:hypothetical protein